MNVTPRNAALTALLLLVMLNGPAESAEISPDNVPASNREVRPPANEPETVEPAPGEPGFGDSLPYFQLACVNCQNGRHLAASRQIRHGVELLKREAKHATAKGKVALNRSIRELSTLADSVEKGTVVSMDNMKAAFAQAHHALAYHYQQRAAESWLQGRFQAAEQDFKSATLEVADGISWVGVGVENKTRDTLVATRELASSMNHGAKVSAEQVKLQAKNLASQIKYLGRRIAQPGSRQEEAQR